MWKLHKDGHYIEILTAKPEWARPQTDRWLGKWRPYHDRLTIVDLSTSKLAASEADLIVDDKPSTVQEWLDAGRRAILFARPHNYDVQQTMPTALNWRDLYWQIKQMWESSTTKERPATT